MKGVSDLYLEKRVDELYTDLKYAINNPDDLSIKIDGKPALVIWSAFPNLKSVGVGFKTLIKQTQEDRAKDYFTSEEEIWEFLDKKDLSPEEKKHRGNALVNALKLAIHVKPGYMLWGDVLFNEDEITNKNDKYIVKPNTVEYEIDPEVFPQIRNDKFGIVFHTVVDKNFKQAKITNINKFMNTYMGALDKNFIITPNDIKINVGDISNLQNKLDKAYQVAKSLDITDTAYNAVKKTVKSLYDRKEVLNKLSDFDDIEDFVNNLYDFIDIKEEILNKITSIGIKSYINGEHSVGEGFVINVKGNEPLKLVSDKGFTKVNKEHMRALNERVTIDGNYVIAWSSSKDTRLFNYYINKNLEYGLTGGSNYGFATYCVTEPPYTKEARIGYTQEYRSKLYGDNIFEFEIPTEKIIFFDYAEYKKTRKFIIQQASFDDFIKVQLDSLGVKLTDEEYAMLKPSDPTKTNSSQALSLYKIFSRYYYQGHRGNLRTPIDGFQYTGRNDGCTLVVWNSDRLIPRQFSTDKGNTWQDFDKNTPEYLEYVEDAKKMVYNYNYDEYKTKIFDGHITVEKKEIYRLLLAYNSNDGLDNKGKLITKISDGIFYNIVIKDDKTIDASFKYNLPYIDHGIHFYRVRKNQFIDKILGKGYKLGKLDCGLKLGSESNKNETWEYFEKDWFPKEVTGGLKLVNLPITKEKFKIHTKLGEKTLYLTKCDIKEDIFSGWNVVLDPEKPCTCTPELKEKLVKKYDWAKGLIANGGLSEHRRERESRLRESESGDGESFLRNAISQVSNSFTVKTFNTEGFHKYNDIKDIDYYAKIVGNLEDNIKETLETRLPEIPNVRIVNQEKLRNDAVIIEHGSEDNKKTYLLLIDTKCCSLGTEATAGMEKLCACMLSKTLNSKEEITDSFLDEGAEEIFSLYNKDKNWKEGLKSIARTLPNCDFIGRGEGYAYVVDRQGVCYQAGRVVEKEDTLMNLLMKTVLFKKLGEEKVSKTDLWNPSDIYIVNSFVYNKLYEEYSEILYDPNKTVIDCNNFIFDQYNQKNLIGISLKKPKKPNAIVVTKYNLEKSVEKPVESYAIKQIVLPTLNYINEFKKEKGERVNGMKIEVSVKNTSGEDTGKKYMLEYRSWDFKRFRPQQFALTGNIARGGKLSMNSMANLFRQLGEDEKPLYKEDIFHEGKYHLPTNILESDKYKSWIKGITESDLFKFSEDDTFIKDFFVGWDNFAKKATGLLKDYAEKHYLSESLVIDYRISYILQWCGIISMLYLMVSKYEAGELNTLLKSLVDETERQGGYNAPFVKVS